MTEINPLNNLVVVLVEPQGARNIGSVVRAMANFGVRRLRLVNPQTDHLQHEARQMAVKAADRLEEAEIYPTLQEALADCHLAYGTTRRFGKYRDGVVQVDTAAGRAVAQAQAGLVALVFGREDKGLKTEELDLCQHFLTIPTSEELPSMNLAQSVALCLYETYTAANNLDGVAKSRKQADSEKLEGMFQHMRETLTSIEYLDPQNPDHILRTFRRMFGRAGLDEREVRVLRGLWSCIDLLYTDYGKKPKE